MEFGVSDIHLGEQTSHLLLCFFLDGVLQVHISFYYQSYTINTTPSESNQRSYYEEHISEQALESIFCLLNVRNLFSIFLIDWSVYRYVSDRPKSFDRCYSTRIQNHLTAISNTLQSYL